MCVYTRERLYTMQHISYADEDDRGSKSQLMMLEELIYGMMYLGRQRSMGFGASHVPMGGFIPVMKAG